MKPVSIAVMVIGAALALAAFAARPSAPAPGAALGWAYPRAPAGPFPAMPPGIQHIPGVERGIGWDEAMDDRNPPDWFPQEHPPAPTIVAHQQPGKPTPCAACHLINGKGFIGAPDLAGLPAAYIVEQLAAFRDGRRRSWEQDRPDAEEMIKAARATSLADGAIAAAWFAALPRRPWIRLVETKMVPATKPDHYGWLDLVPGGGIEPIAGRIIEVPEDTRRTFLSDPHSGLVAYAPIGSVARGRAIVASGGGGGQPCGLCHGGDLHGVGDIPSIAGRAPSYIARMLWDIRSGARAGPGVAPMQGPAKGLNQADIRDVAAYLASLKP